MDEHNEGTPKKRARSKKELFLDAFAECGIILRSAQVAGISRRTVYKWLEHDEEFALAYHQAKEDAKDVVRAEIHRRAVEGWDEEVYQLAKFAGTVHKYSDTLLIVRAKALMPEEYRERQQIEHTGSIDVTGAKELLAQKLAQLRAQEKETSA